MAGPDATTGTPLPEWLAQEIPYLLDWDGGRFDEHFDALKQAARRLGGPASVMAAADRLLADPDEALRALSFDLVAAALIAAADHALVSWLVDAARLIASTGSSEDLRWSVVHALATANDERMLDVLLDYAEDPDSDIRWQVARGIPTWLESLPERAIAVLLSLMIDEDAAVRDWATFALGVLRDEDSPAIRDALAARLDDPGEDTAGEAAVALARRKDRRALPFIVDHLINDAGNLYVEAAAEFADPDLLPLLENLAANGWADDDDRPWVLDEAIAACQSAATTRGGGRRDARAEPVRSSRTETLR